MVIKKIEFTRSTVNNNDTLCNSNNILHAIQNLSLLPSSENSIISYSLTSKTPDQTNIFLEGNAINWQYDSLSNENV